MKPTKTEVDEMVYIIGAGNMARETLNIYIDLDREDEVLGFLEENCERRGVLQNGKPIDDVSILSSESADDFLLIGGIGSPLRRRLITHTMGKGYRYDRVIHPSVIKSRWVEFGEGCIVCAGNIFTSQVTVEDHVIINLGCTISHDVSIGKFATISPGVTITGNIRIGEECFIGAGSVIVEKVTIGNGSFIGAGAVVTKDIPENVLAAGAPARTIRKITEADLLF